MFKTIGLLTFTNESETIIVISIYNVPYSTHCMIVKYFVHCQFKNGKLCELTETDLKDTQFLMEHHLICPCIYPSQSLQRKQKN